MIRAVGSYRAVLWLGRLQRRWNSEVTKKRELQ